MEVAQDILQCNSSKEVVELVNSDFKANLRKWNKAFWRKLLSPSALKGMDNKWLMCYN